MNFNARFLIEYKRYIHLDTIHARNLIFGMYLPRMTFHKSDVAILKILGILWAKMCPKMAAILNFWLFGGHKKTKKQNFQNRYISFVEHHTRKVHAKFQVQVACNCTIKGPGGSEVDLHFFVVSHRGEC